MYVELPPEDPGYAAGMVGRLNLPLYGTRDAAANWQRCVTEHLLGLGFTQGRSNPCMYHHKDRQVRTLVHGDDYASTGGIKDLQWLRGKLEQRFEMKTVIVGHSSDPSVSTESNILNRVIRVRIRTRISE